MTLKCAVAGVLLASQQPAVANGCLNPSNLPVQRLQQCSGRVVVSTASFFRPHLVVGAATSFGFGIVS